MILDHRVVIGVPGSRPGGGLIISRHTKRWNSGRSKGMFPTTWVVELRVDWRFAFFCFLLFSFFFIFLFSPLLSPQPHGGSLLPVWLSLFLVAHSCAFSSSVSFSWTHEPMRFFFSPLRTSVWPADLYECESPECVTLFLRVWMWLLDFCVLELYERTLHGSILFGWGTCDETRIITAIRIRATEAEEPEAPAGSLVRFEKVYHTAECIARDPNSRRGYKTRDHHDKRIGQTFTQFISL